MSNSQYPSNHGGFVCAPDQNRHATKAELTENVSIDRFEFPNSVHGYLSSITMSTNEIITERVIAL